MNDDIFVTIADEEIINVQIGDDVIIQEGTPFPPGGLTNEVLTKLSNANFDMGWRPISDLFSVDWGDIGGTLSAQTDLQNALNAKENVANKSTNTALGTSNTLYPSQNAVKTYVDTAIGDIPTPPVISVNGQTGAVVLDADDVGAIPMPDPLIPKVVIGTTLTTNELGLVGYSLDADAFSLAMRQFTGQLTVADPIVNSDATTKLYVDTGLVLKQNLSDKNQPNGYAGLDVDGKIISTLLPSLVITETFVVASQAAMLALAAQQGDVAVRTDLNKSFILTNNTPSVLSSWQELLTPTDSVLSWNGRTGAVVPISGDYTATMITNTPAGGISAITVQAAINELDTEKANASSLASYVLKAGDVMSGTLTTSGALVASGDFTAAPTIAGAYIGIPSGLNPRITLANGNTGATGAVSIDNSNGTIRFLHSSQGTILGIFSESAFFPGTNLNKKLGDTSAYWSEVFAQRHYVNSTAYMDGAVAGTLAFTGNITTNATLVLSRTSIAASVVINGNQDRPLEINGSDAARVRPFVNNNNATGDAQFSYAAVASTKWSTGYQAATGNFVIADNFSLAASERLTIQTSGRIGIGVTVPTGFIDIRASTTGTAHIRLRTGVAPTTPNDGDIWFDGTSLKIRIGGVTRTFTVT